MKEYKCLIGSKVVKIKDGEIYFDNGKVLSFSKYDTYIESYKIDKEKK